MVAHFGKQRAIALVGARRQPVLLGSTNPSDLIVAAVPAVRARQRHRLRFGFFGEEVAFVQCHEPIVVRISLANLGAAAWTLTGMSSSSPPFVSNHAIISCRSSKTTT